MTNTTTDRKPQEIAAKAQGLTLFAFDRIGNEVAFWECEACGAGFGSLYSGFWCRNCGSVFKNPQRYAGSKMRMAVFKPGEKITVSMHENMQLHQQALGQLRKSWRRDDS